MDVAGRRGPKKGKRVTPEIQTEIVVKALKSSKTLSEIVDHYKKKGFNFNNGLDDELININHSEITFMLSNREVLQKFREEAINVFITDIKSK